MQPSVPVEQALITEQLQRRARAPDYLREKLALHDLAGLMADRPTEILPRLVEIALDVCEAGSAGVSVLEGSVFRWYGLKGSLAAFEGAVTPRNSSPCGFCLDQGGVVLLRHPERVYGWIADAMITAPEVLLVPLFANGKEPIGTLWVVAEAPEHFNGEHARTLQELSTFTGMALHMIGMDQRLKTVLEKQEALAREMSHRVKNVFALTASIVRMSARGAHTKDEMGHAIAGRLSALADAHDLVHRSAGSTDADFKGVEFGDLLTALLRPYTEQTFAGSPILLGESAVQTLALMFHELATNSVKYGALSRPDASLTVSWDIAAGDLVVTWAEANGCPIDPPSRKGFGTTLIENTLRKFGGSISYDWREDGLTATIAVAAERVSAQPALPA